MQSPGRLDFTPEQIEMLMNVNSLTFDFDPQAAEPQEWLRFLNSIWPEDQESQQTIQEWTGYFLIHRYPAA